jgi:hypothetical protein
LLTGETLPTVTPAVQDADKWLRTDPEALALLAAGVRLTAAVRGGAVVIKRHGKEIKRFSRVAKKVGEAKATPVTKRQEQMKAYRLKINTLAVVDRERRARA